MRQRLSEQYAGRFILDADVDADFSPLALHHLFDEFARAVAGRRHQLQRQSMSTGVAADPVRFGAPSGVLQQCLGARRIIAVARRVGGISAVERVDEAVSDRLAAGEQRAADRLPVQATDQRLAQPPVGQPRQAEIDVDMLVDEAGLVDDLETIAMTLLEGEALIEREAEFAGDHVDRAG